MARQGHRLDRRSSLWPWRAICGASAACAVHRDGASLASAHTCDDVSDSKEGSGRAHGMMAFRRATLEVACSTSKSARAVRA
eukprot:469331-Prymnesium_polylepis.1